MTWNNAWKSKMVAISGNMELDVHVFLTGNCGPNWKMP